MTQYLENFILDKDAVLEHASKHPAMHPKRNPTLDVAQKCVVASVEYLASQTVIEQYRPILQEVYDLYEINNGEWKDTAAGEDRDNWETGLDDQVEQMVEPLTSVLSQDWLGRFTINTNLHEEGQIEKWLVALGKEVFKQITYGKTPAQVLSNAGIVTDDIKAMLEGIKQPKNEAQKEMEIEQMADDMQEALGRMRAHLGTGFDIMAVTDDLELLVQDDEILSGAAAQRLGVTQDDLNIAQMLALEIGNEAFVESTVKALQDAGSDIPLPKSKKATKAAAASEPKVQIDGFDGAFVCKMLKEHTGIKETEFAAELGVSKSTFVNWTTGKTVFQPTAEQRETIRNRLLETINSAYSALCMVDGVSVDRTFE